MVIVSCMYCVQRCMISGERGYVSKIYRFKDSRRCNVTYRLITYFRSVIGCFGIWYYTPGFSEYCYSIRRFGHEWTKGVLVKIVSTLFRFLTIITTLPVGMRLIPLLLSIIKFSFGLYVFQLFHWPSYL